MLLGSIGDAKELGYCGNGESQEEKTTVIIKGLPLKSVGKRQGGARRGHERHNKESNMCA